MHGDGETRRQIVERHLPQEDLPPRGAAQKKWRRTSLSQKQTYAPSVFARCISRFSAFTPGRINRQERHFLALTSQNAQHVALGCVSGDSASTLERRYDGTPGDRATLLGDHAASCSRCFSSSQSSGHAQVRAGIGAA
jgi:hypothetical protein